MMRNAWRAAFLPIEIPTTYHIPNEDPVHRVTKLPHVPKTMGLKMLLHSRALYTKCPRYVSV